MCKTRFANPAEEPFGEQSIQCRIFRQNFQTNVASHRSNKRLLPPPNRNTAPRSRFPVSQYMNVEIDQGLILDSDLCHTNIISGMRSKLSRFEVLRTLISPRTAGLYSGVLKKQFRSNHSLTAAIYDTGFGSRSRVYGRVSTDWHERTIRVTAFVPRCTALHSVRLAFCHLSSLGSQWSGRFRSTPFSPVSQRYNLNFLRVQS